MAEGIVDWDQKWSAVKTLTGKAQIAPACRVIEENYHPTIPDNIRHWRDSKPKEEHFLRFFDNMAVFLGCDNANGQVLIDCSYDEFLGHMSPARRDVFKKTSRTKGYVGFNVDLRSHRATPENEWIEDSIVDQKFMYLSRESVDRWNDVLSAGTYETYEYCKSVLKKFLRHKVWTDLVESERLGTICILGAGAYSKDVEIINSALGAGVYSSKKKLRVVVYDSSFYMLADTIRRMEDHLRVEGATDKVDLHPCCADFMNILVGEEYVKPLGDDRVTAFFILGGTLGNIKEEELIEAISGVSDEGDIFIVSGDFAPADRMDEFKEHLKRQYDHDKARDLALGPVRTLFDNVGIPHSASERRKRVKVEIVEAARLPVKVRSNIPGTVCVAFSTKLPDSRKELHLVVSKKYDQNAFNTFMLTQGFEFQEPAFICHEPDFYRLLTFKRLGEK